MPPLTNPGQVAAVVITISGLDSVRPTVHIDLQRSGLALASGSMITSRTERARTEAHAGSRNGVAGRIQPEPSPMARALDQYLAHLKVRKRAQGTLRVYRNILNAAIKDCGWHEPADLTDAALLAYMDSQSKSREWSGEHYNHTLRVFRGFGEYLARFEHVPKNPFGKLETAREDHGPEPRAASTAEARLQLQTMWRRMQEDGRFDPFTLGYIACTFLAGMRIGEPGMLLWKHVLTLDTPTPRILWTPENNKSRMRGDVMICPELAAVLVEHRERVALWSRKHPTVQRKLKESDVERGTFTTDPANPESVVFPTTPSRAALRALYRELGFRPDDLDRPYTTHSARKWFESSLLSAGVTPALVDFLMRHETELRKRYNKPPQGDQSAGLARLPWLWPDRALVEKWPIASQTAGIDLTTKPGCGTDMSVVGQGVSSPTASSPGPESARHTGEGAISGVGTLEQAARGLLADTAKETPVSGLERPKKAKGTFSQTCPPENGRGRT